MKLPHFITRLTSLIVASSAFVQNDLSFKSISHDTTSLLEYGCIRWSMIDAPDSNGKIVDQTAVDNLVDYAINHGINYFDCSPAYLGRKAETAIGLALKTSPQFILSVYKNVKPQAYKERCLNGKELYDVSVEMYRNFKDNMKTFPICSS